MPVPFDEALADPVLALLLTAVAGFAAWRLLLSDRAASTAAGAAVMAIGIYGSAALQQTAAKSVVSLPLTIGLLVIWAVIACSYARNWRAQGVQRHVRPPVGSFAIGTWVAATAVLARLVLLVLPGWRPLALVLGLVAFFIWLFYLGICIGGFQALAGRSSPVLVPGVVLLSTVSSQALALVWLDLLPQAHMLRPFAAGLVTSGALFYVVGVVLIARSHLRRRGWTLIDDWDNSNCILHGALSITGLALVAWNLGAPGLVQALWLVVCGLFIIVETIEVLRLALRVRAYGWRRGAFTYRTSQWSRNFTFGMFYAFTQALSLVDPAPPNAWAAAAQRLVVEHGGGVVLALLLIQIAIWLSGQGRPAAAASPP